MAAETSELGCHFARSTLVSGETIFSGKILGLHKPGPEDAADAEYPMHAAPNRVVTFLELRYQSGLVRSAGNCVVANSPFDYGFVHCLWIVKVFLIPVGHPQSICNPE